MNLQDLLTDEPPFVLRPDEAIASGKRRRRGLGLVVVSSGAVTAGVIATALVVLGGSTPTPTARLGAQPPVTADEPNDGSVSYQIARANTPDSWTIKNMSSETGSWWADVDAGDGANRLGFSHSEGGLQLNPCLDSEYVDGASCTVTVLSPTSTMIVRGYSHDKGGYSSAYAEIVHPNGFGSEVSIDNATWAPIPPGTRFLTPADKATHSLGTIGTPTPIYTTDQLVSMVKAFEATQ